MEKKRKRQHASPEDATASSSCSEKKGNPMFYCLSLMDIDLLYVGRQEYLIQMREEQPDFDDTDTLAFLQELADEFMFRREACPSPEREQYSFEDCNYEDEDRFEYCEETDEQQTLVEFGKGTEEMEILPTSPDSSVSRAAAAIRASHLGSNKPDQSKESDDDARPSTSKGYAGLNLTYIRLSSVKSEDTTTDEESSPKKGKRDCA